MTCDQHFEVARQLSIACNAVHNVWLITGDVEGPARPHGEATQALRDMVRELHAKFDREFPAESNPYEHVPC